jgi:hypothetical protein
MMSVITMKRVMQRIGKVMSFREEISLAWQVGIVGLLIIVLGGFAIWGIHLMELQHAERMAQLQLLARWRLRG